MHSKLHGSRPASFRRQCEETCIYSPKLCAETLEACVVVAVMLNLCNKLQLVRGKRQGDGTSRVPDLALDANV